MEDLIILSKKLSEIHMELIDCELLSEAIDLMKIKRKIDNKILKKARGDINHSRSSNN